MISLLGPVGSEKEGSDQEEGSGLPPSQLYPSAPSGKRVRAGQQRVPCDRPFQNSQGLQSAEARRPRGSRVAQTIGGWSGKGGGALPPLGLAGRPAINTHPVAWLLAWPGCSIHI